VNADASDNVGIFRVKFKIDDSDLAYVTAPPYKAQIATTVYSNGLHSIMAIAFDTSNNTANASIMIIVNNQNQTQPGIIFHGKITKNSQACSNCVVNIALAGGINSTITTSSGAFTAFISKIASPGMYVANILISDGTNNYLRMKRISLI
jgi:hypothetical protein